jgi:hypothetical protein
MMLPLPLPALTLTLREGHSSRKLSQRMVRPEIAPQKSVKGKTHLLANGRKESLHSTSNYP